MKNNIKKKIRFWGNYKGTVIDKGAKEEIKRLENAYNRHRFKNKRNSPA